MPENPASPAAASGRIKRTAQQAQISKQLPLGARLAGGTAQGLMSALAALIAYLPTRPLGLREGFWGSITAIAVVQTELSATQTSARDQFTGAAIGGLVSAVIVAIAGQGLTAYCAAVVLSMLACWLFDVSSAARLAGSTATIILLVPHTGSAGSMVASRIIEVGWGVTVALTIVWLVNWAEKRLQRSPSST